MAALNRLPRRGEHLERDSSSKRHGCTPANEISVKQTYLISLFSRLPHPAPVAPAAAGNRRVGTRGRRCGFAGGPARRSGAVRAGSSRRFRRCNRRHRNVRPSRHHGDMTTLACIGVNVPAPAGAELVSTVTALACGDDPTWFPAVVDGGGRGRTCEVPIGSGAVQIFEVPLPAALPEQLTIRLDDTAAAVARPRAGDEPHGPARTMGQNFVPVVRRGWVPRPQLHTGGWRVSA